MKIEPLAADAVTVHVPFRLVRRGGRTELALPEIMSDRRSTPDNTLVKALARAFRWRKMLESGEFATITELAERERLTLSYVTRVLRLTFLAPDIVEAILAGRCNSSFTLAKAMEPLPHMWNEQRLNV